MWLALKLAEYSRSRRPKMVIYYLYSNFDTIILSLLQSLFPLLFLSESEKGKEKNAMNSFGYSSLIFALTIIYIQILLEVFI